MTLKVDGGMNFRSATPLMSVAEWGSENIITQMINAGANVNAITHCNGRSYSECEICSKGGGHESAMSHAIERHNVGAVRALLDAGADTSGIYLHKIWDSKIRELVKTARYGKQKR